MRLFFNNRQNVALTHHKELFTLELQLGAAVLAIKHFVAWFQDHLFVLRSLSNSLNGSVQGFLFCGVRNDDTANLLFSRCGHYQHAVC